MHNVDVIFQFFLELFAFDIFANRLIGRHEGWQARFATKEHVVRAHSCFCERSGVYDPFYVWKMFGPSVTILEKSLFEIFDDGAIFSFNIALGGKGADVKFCKVGY